MVRRFRFLRGRIRTLARVGALMDELPILHPEELAELRKLLAMPNLTNDQAQVFLKEKIVWDAWQDWLNKKTVRTVRSGKL